jgi:TolB-like protein
MAFISAAVVAIATVLFALNVGSLRDRLLTAFHLKTAATPPGIDSIAVLPLQNLSRDPEQEYFADGLTDALITDLGRVITLRVISRTSVMQYKGTTKPLPEIARELNVDAAVEGTVQRSGGRVRITAQLLQARTDRHLWAESYERDSADVIQLERQLALAIAHEVTGRLTPAQETRLAHSATTNPRAYDAYLRGRYLWGQRTPEPTTAAVGYFEQALREDPHFALAWSGLADCYAVGWWAKNDLPLAEKYARKALDLDPDLAEAHASLGIIDTYRHRFPDAEKELRRAIDLNPNYVMAHHWRSLYLLDRPEEALAENEQARQLDPFSLPVNHLRVYVLLGLHQYDRALEAAETEATIAPPVSLAS